MNTVVSIRGHDKTVIGPSCVVLLRACTHAKRKQTFLLQTGRLLRLPMTGTPVCATGWSGRVVYVKYFFKSTTRSNEIQIFKQKIGSSLVFYRALWTPGKTFVIRTDIERILSQFYIPLNISTVRRPKSRGRPPRGLLRVYFYGVGGRGLFRVQTNTTS